jgi:hypothetical protein
VKTLFISLRGVASRYQTLNDAARQAVFTKAAG